MKVSKYCGTPYENADFTDVNIHKQILKCKVLYCTKTNLVHRFQNV